MTLTLYPYMVYTGISSICAISRLHGESDSHESNLEQLKCEGREIELMTNDGEEVIADYAEMDDARVTITVFSIGLYRVLRIGKTGRFVPERKRGDGKWVYISNPSMQGIIQLDCQWDAICLVMLYHYFDRQIKKLMEDATKQ